MKSLGRVRLFATPCTVAHQAPLSMGFSRQDFWSGLPPVTGPQPLSSLQRAGNWASRPGHRALARSSLLRDWFPYAGAVSNLPFELSGRAGDCSRVTEGQKRPHLGLFPGYNVPLHRRQGFGVGRKVMTNLDSIFKSRDIPLPTKVRLVKAWT